MPYTPIEAKKNVNVALPVFCSTQVLDRSTSSFHSAIPEVSDPALNNLIAHISQQVDQTMMSPRSGET